MRDQNIKRTKFIRYYIHFLGIVYLCFGHMDKGWDLSLYIIQSMYFNTSLMCTKVCPSYSFGHKSIVVKSNAYIFPFSLNMSFALYFLSYRMRSFQRYDSPVSRLLLQVCFMLHVFHPKMVIFLLMCIQRNNQTTKTFTVAQLSGHQSKKLIPTSKMLNMPIAIIFLYDTDKLVVNVSSK